jgi:hypothetical protein
MPGMAVTSPVNDLPPIALMEDGMQDVAVIRSVEGLVGCVSRMPCHREVGFRTNRPSGQIQSRCGS